MLALSLAFVALTAAPPATVLAADDLPGSELLTSQERAEYRQRMRGMLSAGQQEQIRRHYERLIQQRAKQQGIALPGQPSTSPGQGAGSRRGGSGGAAQ
jgi:hypothetical protein